MDTNFIVVRCPLEDHLENKIISPRCTLLRQSERAFHGSVFSIVLQETPTPSSLPLQRGGDQINSRSSRNPRWFPRAEVSSYRRILFRRIRESHEERDKHTPAYIGNRIIDRLGPMHRPIQRIGDVMEANLKLVTHTSIRTCSWASIDSRLVRLV